MRLLLALLLWSVGASAATLPEYYVHLQGKPIAGMLVWQDTREWLSMWVAYPNGDMAWRDPRSPGPGSVEHQVIRDGFFVLNGFDQWPADCVRAELEDINSGVVTTLPCTKGHFYSPLLIPRDPWRMRIWGVIPGKKFYWEADFYPSEQMTNPCWIEGPKTAEVIRQKEVWYDTGGGWVRGSGTNPWDAAGKPIRPTVNKQWEVTVAKGYGIWTMKDLATGKSMCAYSIWNWN